jgi:hypothetical protein
MTSEHDARVAEIKARSAAATPGPWNVTELEGHWISGAGYVQGMTYYVFEAEQRGDGECGSMLKEDAEFVAHSREDVPFLLDRLAEARTQLAASEAATARLVEAADMLANTVALMNSMIRSGESHSPTSEKVMRESLDAYRALSGTAGQGGAGEV